MLKVHHLENSRSHRIIWLLEELSLEYEIIHYKRDPISKLAPKELRSIHPLGKSPILSDGEQVIAESGAIISYLVENYGNGQMKPTGKNDRLQYEYWMHAAEGSLMPLIVMKLVFDKTTKAPVPFFLRPVTKTIAQQVGKAYINPGIAAHLDLAESHLSKHIWFGGTNFSAVDIQMSYPLEASEYRANLLSNYPKIKNFLDSIRLRPSYKKAIERGGNLNFNF